MAPVSPLRLLAGWPRRAAAALCLVLALASAVSGKAARTRHATGSPIPAGMVATAAAVSEDAAAFVHVGDHIDLIAPADASLGQNASSTPAIVASGVQVLAVRSSTDGLSGPRSVQLLVAAHRDVAVQIAAHQGTQVLAAVTVPP
jgi:hypothetical protein